MRQFFLAWFATSGAAALAGVLSFIWLLRTGRHRNPKTKRLSRLHISSSIMLAAVFYTFIIILIGYFGLRIAVSDIIENGFGNDRVAWLFVFACIDVGVHLARVFDGTIFAPEDFAETAV